MIEFPDGQDTTATLSPLEGNAHELAADGYVTSVRHPVTVRRRRLRAVDHSRTAAQGARRLPAA
ncbi:hypothetical protein LGM90_15875 [Burkholderia sp. AU28942]|uniref:hypothetical protein n=1 Tax=Burkholderia TaxID=32008 RepID=UPI0008418780|nr:MULTISPECIES: hypothetical protein [Burkholderia]AOK06833.1 hypothetical protein WK25_19920 [Burkholderia latens]MCA8309986.1 hypothetical protein [Burkholderia sp. AU28942]